MQKHMIRARVPTDGPTGKVQPGYVVATVECPNEDALRFFRQRLRWSHWEVVPVEKKKADKE